MTHNPTHTASRQRSPTMTPLLAAWQGAGLGALGWLTPTIAERMSDMGSAWLSFVAARVQEDVALQHALLHAGSPTEAQAVQIRFLQTALEQYSAETGKMLDLSARLFEPVAPNAGTRAPADDDENVNV